MCVGGVLRGHSQKYTRPNMSELNLTLLDDFQWVCSLLWWRRGLDMWSMRCRDYTLGSFLPPYCGQSAVSDVRVKDPRCCLSCPSLLPANAPVPSNTDKYCPNPELSLYTETAEGKWLWIGFKVTVVVSYLAANLDQWLQESPKYWCEDLFLQILNQWLGCIHCSLLVPVHYSN